MVVQDISGNPVPVRRAANGNLTGDGSSTYLYDVENRLVSAGGGSTASLRYDPLGRLYETSGGAAGITRFLYDGDELVAEYTGSGAMLRRYVHGSGNDDPMAWFEGESIDSNVAKLIKTNHQGSVIALTDGQGNLTDINSYDEWGIPAPTNTGRFHYTGQAWIPELRMYYYKARIYSPTLGRFLQTDPIGYDDQVNLYAYVGNDPVNGTDPDGTCTVATMDRPSGVECAGSGIKSIFAAGNYSGNNRREDARQNKANEKQSRGERLQKGATVVGTVSAVRSIVNPATNGLKGVAGAKTATAFVKGVPMAGQVAATTMTYAGQVADGKSKTSAGINTLGQVIATGLAGAGSGMLAASQTANPYIIAGAGVLGAVGVEFSGAAQAAGDKLENVAEGVAVMLTGRPPY